MRAREKYARDEAAEIRQLNTLLSSDSAPMSMDDLVHRTTLTPRTIRRRFEHLHNIVRLPNGLYLSRSRMDDLWLI